MSLLCYEVIHRRHAEILYLSSWGLTFILISVQLSENEFLNVYALCCGFYLVWMSIAECLRIPVGFSCRPLLLISLEVVVYPFVCESDNYRRHATTPSCRSQGIVLTGLQLLSLGIFLICCSRCCCIVKHRPKNIYLHICLLLTPFSMLKSCVIFHY